MLTESLSPFGRRLLTFGRRSSVQTAGAFLLIATVMSVIEFSGPAILDNDGYYHIRWSKMLRESLPALPRFESLPMTTLNEHDYADHHFLFHVLLIPFTFADLRIGAKLAAVVFSSLGLASLFALLTRYRIPYRWLWLAPLVASSSPFLYRMSMTRAPSLSITLLAAGCWFLFERKPIALALLSFAFAWSYSLFPLIIAFSLAFAVSAYAAERLMDLRFVGATIAGSIAGLVLNPYFPNDVILLGKHVLMKFKSDYDVPVGLEWYPYETWVMLEGSAIAFGIYIAALALFEPRRQADKSKTLFLLFVSILLLIALFKSRRFIEYWPPFAIIFAAFAVKLPSWQQLTASRGKAVAAGGLLIAMTAVMTANVYRGCQSIRSEPDPFAYRGAAEWLASNTPAGSMVFNTDWDDFPMLFYYNTHNRYVAGLDPTYLYERDAALWDQYQRVTVGKEPDSASIIADRFGAKYVFTDNDHHAFLDTALGSGHFRTVYSDRYATVLEITEGH